MKPFDLEAAKVGKPVCTEDGWPVRILCFDRKGERTIVAAINKNGHETIACFWSNGSRTTGSHLYMVGEKKEGAVVTYLNYSGKACVSGPYINEVEMQEAIRLIKLDECLTFLGFYPFTWEE